MRKRSSGEERERHNWSKGGERRPGSGASPTRSGGGDELHGQDAGDDRVWFMERSDVKSRQTSDHDEMIRLSEEGR